MKVDTHFHIFLAKAIHSANGRYPVTYDAPLTHWQSLTAQHGILGGVVIQPSFLGFDNSFLLKAIQESPNTLRGVVVIDPKTTRSQLEELKEQGIQGVRLNLYGNSNPLGVIRNHLSLIELINESGMHLQLHHDDGLINTLLCEIPSGTEIVLDHFGRPKSESELLDAKGISRHIGKLWVKLSAQYRTPQIDHGRILQLWSNLIGAEAFVWGSDWPHTQFEATQSFLDQMNAINKLVSNEYLLNQILVTNPKKLYWS